MLFLVWGFGKAPIFFQIVKKIAFIFAYFVTMGKKNLLLIVNQLHFGGAQKVVANLSRDLSSDFNVFVTIFNDIDNVGYDHGGKLICIKAPFSRKPDQNPSWARAARMIFLVRALRKIKKEHKIDVALSFLEASNIINLLSRRKEKVIVSVRSFLSKELQNVKEISVYGRFVRKLYNKADRVVVPSTALGDDLKANFGVNAEKISVVNNYLDQDRLGSLKEEPLESAVAESIFRNPVLINVGRLHEAKGQIYLLPVLKSLLPVFPELKLVIVGGGPLEEQIALRCHELGLRVCHWQDLSTLSESTILHGNVFLLGMRQNPYKYLSRSTLFLFPSLYEGFPNALIEAMAMGLPAIAADCNSGPREILAPGTEQNKKAEGIELGEFGILMPVPEESGFEKTDLANWVAACKRLLEDEEERHRLARQSLQRASQYSKETIVGKWKILINQ